MTDISFLQCQSTRTRLATDQSVQATTLAAKTAFEECDDVVAWNQGPYDLYVEGEEGRYDEGYRANVDVYDLDDRTHVLVDSSPLLFHGSIHDDWTMLKVRKVTVRHDHFHDVVVTAIVAALTDTPKRRVASTAWEPRPDVGFAENASAQVTQRPDSTTAEAPGRAPSKQPDDEERYVKEVTAREHDPYSPHHAGNVAMIVVFGFGLVSFVSLGLAMTSSFIVGFLVWVVGAFVVLLAVAVYQEDFT